MRDFILGYLLNGAWEAPLIAAGAFLLLRFAKLDARERCWAGIGFLAVAVVLPAIDPRLAASFTPPRLPQIVADAVAPPQPSLATDFGPLAQPAQAPSAQPDTTPILASALTVAAPSPEASAPAAATSPSPITLAPLVGQAMVWLFLAAIILGAGRLALGLVAAGRLARRAQPIELPARVLAPMKRLAVTQGRKPPQVRMSASLSVPAAIGGAAPTILVPADFERHGEEAMIAALLHECAHVVRGDYGVNLACEALALPLIWHPAIHLIKSQVQADREAACDRLAATQMPTQRYAACLVALAGAMSPAPRVTGAVMQTLFGPLFGRGELERRVRALLQAPLGAARERLPRAFAIGGPVLGAVVALGLVLHVEAAMAQPAPPPAPPAPALIAAAPLPPAPPAPPALAARAEPAEPAAPAMRPKHVRERSVHRWTSEDGKTHVVISDNDRDLDGKDDHHLVIEDEKALSADEQAKIDAEVEAGKAEAAKARAYYHSAEFHEKMRQAAEAATAPAIAQARAEAAKAEAYVHSAEFRQKMAEVRTQQRVIVLKRGEIVAQLDKVKQILRDPEIEKALRQAKDAGPEVQRALDEIDREINNADLRIRSIPPVPPVPPVPPPPPAPPAPVYDR